MPKPKARSKRATMMSEKSRSISATMLRDNPRYSDLRQELSYCGVRQLRLIEQYRVRGVANYPNSSAIATYCIGDLVCSLRGRHWIVMSHNHKNRTRNTLQVGPEVHQPRLGIQMRNDVIRMLDHARPPFRR
jgi:hypothetical protein